jgi:phage baseplate assembly protein W
VKNRIPPRPSTDSIVQGKKVPLGIRIPYGRDNEYGYFSQIYTDLEKVKTNLKMLLLTAKGERPMMPTYGSDLKAVLFEPSTTELSDVALEDTIIETTEMWMPEIVIDEVNIKRPEAYTEEDRNNPYTVEVELVFSVINIPNSTQELNLTVDV